MNPGVARRDPRLRATVVERTPLRYALGADPAQDRPAHVRAASAVVRWRDGLLIVQDDAGFIAWMGPDGSIAAIELPAGPDGKRLFDATRGNKAQKLDLEAAFALGDLVIALGSGSSDRRRRVAVVPLHDEPGRVRLLDATPLYEALGKALPGELNIEGAFRHGPSVRLLQRGNGRGAADATADVPLDWFERLLAGATPGRPDVAARPWHLGDLGGAALTFTDGLAADRGWWFLAAAEASPNAIDDGPVAGSALGRASDDEASWAPLVDASGQIVPLKAEGLCPSDRPGEMLVVVDADDPSRPAELLRVALDGPWGH